MVKYKLVGGPLHAKRFFHSENLPKLVMVKNGTGEVHPYIFVEMRGLNYFVYNYVGDIANIEVNGSSVCVNSESLS